MIDCKWSKDSDEYIAVKEDGSIHFIHKSKATTIQKENAISKVELDKWRRGRAGLGLEP